MRIDVLSLSPLFFQTPFQCGILKRACEKNILNINLIDIRDFTLDKHRKVDDRPYGGGPGMVLMAQPVCDAIRSVKQENSHVIYLSPQGQLLAAPVCRQLAQQDHLILLCGHYEGVDERVLKKEVHEEISIGNYVLTSGCIAAVVLIDSVARFVPGVLGNEASAEQDSFEKGILDMPHYTRPVNFEGSMVPDILTKGNHAEINRWRQQQAESKTFQTRPELVIHRRNSESMWREE